MTTVPSAARCELDFETMLFQLEGVSDLLIEEADRISTDLLQMKKMGVLPQCASVASLSFLVESLRGLVAALPQAWLDEVNDRVSANASLARHRS
ncbi:hypothetical protein [Zavarzinia aquatilis]|uniref:Uncharacterized protein n=1 Tax=Zavarzinia aquatilis TaxID=2211142 RepID=A0A317ECF1_9PROT|nr:hypothetical protein [Zavarzinia aquatilis]PWR24579.1 hypothetical protein DKG74_07175 [Zavarzinia aquatilis]